MSLHDHLRPDQNIRLVPGKRGQYLQLCVFSGNRIAVKPQDSCGWKALLYLRLNLLRAKPECTQILAPAFRACGRHPLRVPAIVAYQISAPVQSQRNIAVRAPEGMAAGGTDHRARIPSAVQKEHDLLPPLQRIFHLGPQRAAQNHAVR